MCKETNDLSIRRVGRIEGVERANLMDDYSIKEWQACGTFWIRETGEG